MSSSDIVWHVSGTFMLSSTALLWSSVPFKLISTQSLWQTRSLFASSKRKGMLWAWLRGACWPILCHINRITGRPDAEHIVSHLHFHLIENLHNRFPAKESLIKSLFPVAMEVIRHFRCWLCDPHPLLLAHSAARHFLAGSLAGRNYLAMQDLFHPHSSCCAVKSVLYLH